MATTTEDRLTIEQHPILTGEEDPLLPPAANGDRGLPRGVLDWRQALGATLILAGAVVLAVAWWGVSGSAESSVQLPYFLSGGLGGGALIAAGLTVLIAYEHHVDRQTMGRLEDRLRRLEARLGEDASRR